MAPCSSIFSGSFLLGFFLIWTGERVLADPRWRLLMAIGLCGSYTTFSRYAFETFHLGEQGQWRLNVVGSNLLCLAAVMQFRLETILWKLFKSQQIIFLANECVQEKQTCSVGGRPVP